MTDNTITIDHDIDELVHQVRDYQNTVAEMLNAIYDIKLQLAALLESRGQNWWDDSGYARLAQEEISIVYNAQALDELVLSDPAQFGWLREHRSEIVIPQRVLIR